jgi:2-C-methyl-D-erythritol 2,4-cyclodiphosphate synthase
MTYNLTRIGTGLDVHAFADGVPLWLGGVQIPHTRGLAGHSDGDVAIHALIDALLGASGRGDIGEWFPSSDERWRGARGAELLRTVWTALLAEGWQFGNADLTIVASAPRLAPYRDPMRQALAGALGVPRERVSVKFTTTDGLGPLGTGDGAMALASALLTRRL